MDYCFKGKKTTTILGRIKFVHTTTFNISVHYFWADAKWSTFTWSMPAKVVLHRKKYIYYYHYCMMRKSGDHLTQGS